MSKMWCRPSKTVHGRVSYAKHHDGPLSKWRVYYDDGSTWNWTEGFDLEPYGIICILQETATVNRSVFSIISNAPYYVYTDKEWIKAEPNDIEDYLVHGIRIEKFVVGRAVSKRKFVEIFNIAMRDKDAENL